MFLILNISAEAQNSGSYGTLKSKLLHCIQHPYQLPGGFQIVIIPVRNLPPPANEVDYKTHKSPFCSFPLPSKSFKALIRVNFCKADLQLTSSTENHPFSF
ncbi:hypothetical protein AVEN_18684-1 [Araneus ventricosus]|uniref:Uncharacterized protein n=1 Tax=Araneus ventricosus TaxID=182803 RepID=A0A4Y2IB60_ARAVE|nr:hypothetical protein AVEN_18684-1 [Araneus ventricosus]